MGYNKSKRAADQRKKARKRGVVSPAVVALVSRHMDQKDPRSDYARTLVAKHAGIPAHADALEWMKKQVEMKEYRHEDLVPIIEIVENTINPDMLTRMMVLHHIAPNRYKIPEALYTKIEKPETEEQVNVADQLIEAIGEEREAIAVTLPDGSDATLIGTPGTIADIKLSVVEGASTEPNTGGDAFEQLRDDTERGQVLSANADGTVDVDPSVINTDGAVHATHAHITTDADGNEHVLLVGDNAPAQER